MKISFIAEPGALSFGISGLIDALTIANTIYESNFFNWEIISSKKEIINLAGGLKLMPDKSYDSVTKTDIVVVPGYLPNADIIPNNCNKLFEFIKKRHQSGAIISSVCTGTFTIAETGLLDNYKATTNWVYAYKFQKKYPKIKLKREEIVVEDNNIITCGAVRSFYNLALHLIEKFMDKKTAEKCSNIFLIEKGFTSQTPFTSFLPFKNHNDKIVLSAQNYMEENYWKNLLVEDVEKKVNISPRQFKRRFKNATGETALNYIQKLRIESAKTMLIKNNKNIDEITFAIGYENSSTFRKLFKKHVGITPSQYRDKFS